MVSFRVAISAAPDLQGSGRVVKPTYPNATEACAAEVVMETASSGKARVVATTGTEGHVTYHSAGLRIYLCNRVKLAHDVY